MAATAAAGPVGPAGHGTTPRRPKRGPLLSGTKIADYTEKCPRWIEIKGSTIPGAGRGAFAATDLPKGVYLGEYAGKLYDYDWAMKNLPDDTYFFEVGQRRSERFPRKIIDAQDEAFANWTRFMNCSTAKTANILGYTVGHHVEFYARHDIPAGTELLYYYGLEYARSLGVVPEHRKRKRERED